MGLFMRVKFSESKWVGGSDYYARTPAVVLGVDRSTGGGAAGIAEVLSDEDYLTKLFLSQSVQRAMLCKFLTDCDDEWYAICTLERVGGNREVHHAAGKL